MSHYSRHNYGLPANPVAGFTLIELIVSIGIISVILAVVISNQSTYTDLTTLTNLADEIGLTISQAQAYGIGVKEFSPASGDFTISYGLTFSLLGSGSASVYLSFADRNKNKIYDGDWSCLTGGASECLSRNDISRGNIIDSLCVVRTSGLDQCNVARRIDLSFARPRTEAQLVFFNSGGQVFSPSNVKGVRIVLKSPGGSTRSVVVYETGQISVQ